MKILVTGKEGQLARSLAECSADMRDMNILFAGRPEFDLERPETLSRLIAAMTPDVVINAAAYTAVDAAEDDPDRARRINALAAGEIAAAARRADAQFIQISTDYVFDGTGSAPYREEDPVNPINAYGRSKLLGEEIVRRECPKSIILRTSWLYSPFGKNFVKTMLGLAGRQRPLRVVEDQQGSPTCALDLAAALLTMLRHWNNRHAAGQGAIYHLSGSGGASWHALARHIFDISALLNGPAVDVAGIPAAAWGGKASRPANSQLDSTKFARDFGHRLPHWQSSVAAVVRRLIVADQSLYTPSLALQRVGGHP